MCVGHVFSVKHIALVCFSFFVVPMKMVFFCIVFCVYIFFLLNSNANNTRCRFSLDVLAEALLCVQ